jgi:hypothetical protein
MSRTVFVLHSAFSPQSVAEVLGRSIDEEHWTLFSMSGFKGSRLIIGRVEDNTFRLRKRRYSRNDFAGIFYGRFEPERGGTRIEGHFDMPRWAKYFMRVWLAFAVLIGTPIFLGTLLDIAAHRDYMTGDKWVGLAVPPVLLLCGTVLPQLGRVLGRRDRETILQHIESTLAARLESNADVA